MNTIKSALLIPVGLVLLIMSMQSHAVPSFARQTGRACASCHFQHFPTLNAEGREFAASGYTEVGKQQLIEKTGLSLPGVENLSVFTKLRYRKTNGIDRTDESTTNSGQLEFPDEFVVFYGGRVSQNVGFLLETQLPESGESVFASFKMPFMYEVGDRFRIGAIPYTTDALGAAYGFEYLNTGAVRSNRILEPRTDISAQQFIGTSSAANGVALVASHPWFFVNFSKWSPNHATNVNGRSNGRPSANYIRAALTPTLGDWDFGIGVQQWDGEADQFDTEDDPATGGINEGAIPTKFTVKARAFDIQAQGKIGAMPFGIYLTTAKADGTPAGAIPNFFNSRTADEKSTAVVAEIGVVPGIVTLVAGYRNGENGRTTFNIDKALTYGITYSMAQNIVFQLLHVDRSGSAYDAGAPALQPGGTGDKLTMLVLSAGF